MKRTYEGMLDAVTVADSIHAMKAIPDDAIDLVFADPPYNLSLGDEALTRPDHSAVNGVRETWDVFADLTAYDAFTRTWLKEVRRVLRPGGTIYVMGSYHNIFQVGTALQDLGFWILNDIVWIKENPMPNFRGMRFANAHETLIWAVRDRSERSYTFNYELLKAGNEDVQLRSDWVFPLCGGKERSRNADGSTSHPTQKPLALVRRAILAATRAGDVVLDPFLGSGTTAVAAKELGRRFVGIEQRRDYALVARARIAATTPLDDNLVTVPESRRIARRVAFSSIVDSGLIAPGAVITCPKNENAAVVRPDGTLAFGERVGSIHQMAAAALGQAACNGWPFWHYHRERARAPIDELRQMMRRMQTT